MCYSSGFDMVPRLTSSDRDEEDWALFLSSIDNEYCSDDIVTVKTGYYVFDITERPKLPKDGTKFLSFSSKVGGGLSEAVEPYIITVHELAGQVFGDRIKGWNEGAYMHSQYGAKEIAETVLEYGGDDNEEWPVPNGEGFDGAHYFEEAYFGGDCEYLVMDEEHCFSRDLTACDRHCGFCGQCQY